MFHNVLGFSFITRYKDGVYFYLVSLLPFTIPWIFLLSLDIKTGSIFIPFLCYRDTRIQFHRWPAHLPLTLNAREEEGVYCTLSYRGFWKFHFTSQFMLRVFFSLCFFLTSKNKRIAPHLNFVDRFACDIPPDGQPLGVSVDLMIFNCQGNRRKWDFGHGLEGRF